ncbi:hypothetical protein FSP39_015030 [Pinctada imbricata]|uniref:Fibrinogen C-terminal domain-containing protein n=1 Tax=Pinctada imbricata TaxID=66713 RepID=A0AA88YQN2_PINIB|nr:hypothetical protein FSP39_015030 [Pinctada imbricata]
MQHPPLEFGRTVTSSYFHFGRHRVQSLVGWFKWSMTEYHPSFWRVGHHSVIQRRYDGSVDFAQDWNNYTHGFGFLDTEFWIGNDIIHQLTSLGRTSLLVHLHDHYGTFKYAHYDNFEVESESRKFQLHISGYSGTAGDSLGIASDTNFSTIDQDNDQYIKGNCVAMKGKGGWWFKNCTPSALNGQYCNIGIQGHQCNRWHKFEEDDRGMAKTLLLIRRND